MHNDAAGRQFETLDKITRRLLMVLHDASLTLLIAYTAICTQGIYRMAIHSLYIISGSKKSERGVSSPSPPSLPPTTAFAPSDACRQYFV